MQPPGTGGRRAGYTMIEILIVLMVSAIMVTLVAQTYASYARTRAAQQAATILGRDLRLARSAAIRSRRAVSLVVNEAGRSYVIRDTAGVVVAQRAFSYGDLQVQGIDLGLTGDSVTFDRQGLADLSGVGGVAEARIASPSEVYVVRFNATGSSTIEEE